MSKHGFGRMIPACLFGIVVLVNFPAHADTACFASSKSYQIHPLRGGPDIRDGWSVKGGAFNQCVRQAQAADKTLQAKYPGTIYALSLAATIGCHEPC